jgi:hypothetical protein
MRASVKRRARPTDHAFNIPGSGGRRRCFQTVEVTSRGPEKISDIVLNMDRTTAQAGPAARATGCGRRQAALPASEALISQAAPPSKYPRNGDFERLLQISKVAWWKVLQTATVASYVRYRERRAARRRPRQPVVRPASVPERPAMQQDYRFAARSACSTRDKMKYNGNYQSL